MQINNIRIKYHKKSNKWQAITPGKKILEEFDRLSDIVDWAHTIKDYIQ